MIVVGRELETNTDCLKWWQPTLLRPHMPAGMSLCAVQKKTNKKNRWGAAAGFRLNRYLYFSTSEQAQKRLDQWQSMSSRTLTLNKFLNRNLLHRLSIWLFISSQSGLLGTRTVVLHLFKSTSRPAFFKRPGLRFNSKICVNKSQRRRSLP